MVHADEMQTHVICSRQCTLTLTYDPVESKQILLRPNVVPSSEYIWSFGV